MFVFIPCYRPRCLQLCSSASAVLIMAFRWTSRSTVTLRSATTWCTRIFSKPRFFVVPNSHPSGAALIKLSRGPSNLVLPYDILFIIFEFVSDVKTLFNACLVCKAFDDVANKILWRRLTDDPLCSKVRNLLQTLIYRSKGKPLMCHMRQFFTMKKTQGPLIRSLLWDSAETYNH